MTDILEERFQSLCCLSGDKASPCCTHTRGKQRFITELLWTWRAHTPTHWQAHTSSLMHGKPTHTGEEGFTTEMLLTWGLLWNSNALDFLSTVQCHTEALPWKTSYLVTMCCKVTNSTLYITRRTSELQYQEATCFAELCDLSREYRMRWGGHSIMTASLCFTHTLEISLIGTYVL